MGRRSWTELFFLDEAVALAAGHRPCFRCRREAAEAFRAAWMAAVRKEESFAAAIDMVLHRERMEHGRKLIHAIPGPLSELPDGAVIAMSGSAFTVSGGQAFRWTEYGYEPPQRIPRADGLLTPPSTLMTLRAGYRPALHPTLEASRPGQHHHETCLTPTREASRQERKLANQAGIKALNKIVRTCRHLRHAIGRSRLINCVPFPITPPGGSASFCLGIGNRRTPSPQPPDPVPQTPAVLTGCVRMS